MIIQSSQKEYEVSLQKDFSFLRALMDQENTMFVIDEKVYSLYYDVFAGVSKDRLMLICALENNKVIDTALSICEKMTAIPAKRNAHLVSVGGGIIQDITGFAANILYRGIHWTFVATTLLAASDSCIGGKTSLNYKQYKNLLGTFYPPDSVIICPLFFRTLSEADYLSGLGEVVKFNLMAGQQGLALIEESMNGLLSREEKLVRQFVQSALNFKKNFIETDEFDRGERIKLNFAHTFGHAIETVTSYAIPHGTAVAIGMIMANYLSQQRKMLTPELTQRMEKVLLRIIMVDGTLLTDCIPQFVNAMRKDKKQTSSALTAVLMAEQPSELVIVRDVSEQEVKGAVEYFLNLYQENRARV